MFSNMAAACPNCACPTTVVCRKIAQKERASHNTDFYDEPEPYVSFEDYVADAYGSWEMYEANCPND